MRVRSHGDFPVRSSPVDILRNAPLLQSCLHGCCFCRFQFASSEAPQPDLLGFSRGARDQFGPCENEVFLPPQCGARSPGRTHSYSPRGFYFGLRFAGIFHKKSHNGAICPIALSATIVEKDSNWKLRRPRSVPAAFGVHPLSGRMNFPLPLQKKIPSLLRMQRRYQAVKSFQVI